MKKKQILFIGTEMNGSIDGYDESDFSHQSCEVLSLCHICSVYLVKFENNHLRTHGREDRSWSLTECLLSSSWRSGTWRPTWRLLCLLDRIAPSGAETCAGRMANWRSSATSTWLFHRDTCEWSLLTQIVHHGCDFRLFSSTDKTFICLFTAVKKKRDKKK